MIHLQLSIAILDIIHRLAFYLKVCSYFTGSTLRLRYDLSQLMRTNNCHNTGRYPSRCLLFKTRWANVRTSQETHYVSTVIPSSQCDL
jgi:hypothetical protein